VALIGPTPRELARLIREGIKAMPDTATVLRQTITNTYAGPDANFAQPTTQVVTSDILAMKPDIAPGTTPCRLTASVLGGGDEQELAGQLGGLMPYTLTVPPNTDIRLSDRVLAQDLQLEVRARKGGASWNLSDSYTCTEVQRG
jgi:hypothetical protein